MTSTQLNIKLGEYWLDIPSDISVKYRWVNNIFHEETNQRERTLAFNIAATPKNNVALRWLFSIGTPNNAPTKYVVQVFLGHTFLFHAAFRVNETERGYRVYLLGKYGSLSDLIGNDKLTDLDWTINFPSLDETDVANGSYPDYPAWNPAVYYPLAHKETDLTSFLGLHNYLYSPFASVARAEARHAPYLLSIFDAIAGHYGIPNVNADRFASDNELQNLIMLSVGRCTQTSTQPPLGLLPDMKIMDFLRSLEIMFCCQFSIDNSTETLKVDFLKDAANNTALDDWTSKLASPIKRVWENNVEALKLDWSDSFRDAYKPTETPFNNINNVIGVTSYPPGTWGSNTGTHKPYFGNNTIIRKEEDGTWIPIEYTGYIGDINVVDPNGTAFIGDFDSYADLPDIFTFPNIYDNKIVYVTGERRYYRGMGAVGKWVYYFTRCAPFESEGTQTKFVSQLAPAFMEVEFDFIQDYPFIAWHVNDWWRLPIVKGASIPDKFPSVQLAFKRGIRQSWEMDGPHLNLLSYNHDYTYASSDEFDTDRSDAFNYSLHWDGEKGLYNTWWYDWANILIGAQEIEAEFNLTVTDISKIDFSRPVYVQGAKCYIKEIDLHMPLNGATKVKLLKIP